MQHIFPYGNAITEEGRKRTKSNYITGSEGHPDEGYKAYFGVQGKSILGLQKAYFGVFREGAMIKEREGFRSFEEKKIHKNIGTQECLCIYFPQINLHTNEESQRGETE